MSIGNRKLISGRREAEKERGNNVFFNSLKKFVDDALQVFQKRHKQTIGKYPIKNYRRLSPGDRGKRWAYVLFIRGAANYPIIYP